MSPISEPDLDLDAVEIPDEGPMTFEFDLEVRPEFDVPPWKGLRIQRPVYEFVEEDGDELTNVLMDILFRDKKNREMEKKEGKIKCLICEQVNEGVTDDNPYSVCSDCFVELRAEFLNILGYDEERATNIEDKYRIFKMPDEFQMDKKRLMAILLAKKQYAKRDIVDITYKTPSKEGRAIFELYDLKFWEVPEPTIICIMAKIFEFTPGCYLMIKNE